MGVTTVSNSLILGGWETKGLRMATKNREVEEWVTQYFDSLCYWLEKKMPLEKTAFGAIFSIRICKVS